MSILNKFINVVNNKANDVAIRTSKQTKTYGQLYEDVNKLIRKFETLKVEKKSKVLLLINMSYEMYVSVFASILYGLDVVIIDNFKDKTRVNKQIEDVKVDYVLTNNITSFLKNFFKPLRKINKINVEKVIIKEYTKVSCDFQTNSELITFTSGGTGNPKPVRRTLEDLENQLNLTLSVVGDLTSEYVLATLPIYGLACIVEGIKIYIPNKKEDIKEVLEKEENTVMFSSISTYLKVRKAPKIKQAFFGGSILYYAEARKIFDAFPNANITYIYGATEASIISTTTLDKYIESLESNKLCLGDILPNNNVQTKDEEIIVSKGIITNSYLNEEKHSFHATKDLGYVENNQIFLTGRKVNDDVKSNYLLEMLVKKEFNDIFNIAILNIKGEYHVYLEEKDISKRLNIVCILENYIESGIIHIVKKLPLDYRHQAKIDYKKLLKIK